MSRRGAMWAMVVVLLVAAALRLVEFGRVPPGLYHDEAYHGLDAPAVPEGRFPLYFPANNGREPLFIYLVALAVGVWGPTPFALRLPSFFAGMLTVAVSGALGKALFSRRVGVLAAAVLAGMLWHVHLSRVGFRAVLLPLFSGLALWQGTVAVRRPDRLRSARWAGLFYGLSFYTYTAARFTPVVLGVYWLLLAVRRGRRSGMKVPGKVLLAAAVVCFLTVLPLGLYTVLHPRSVLGRPGQVFFWNQAISHGDPWGMLAGNVVRTAGMFFLRGDRIWRHNLPRRPIFAPVLGAMFLLGLFLSLSRRQHDPAALLAVVWTAVMSLPTLLAEDAPHFLRAVGILPVVVFLPALGLDWVCRRPVHRSGVFLLVTGVLAWELLGTAWAYFGEYAPAPQTAYWFEEGAVGLAGSVNRFLGIGWDGERMLHAPVGGRHVYLERALWEQWPQVRFLVSDPERMAFLPVARPPTLGTGVAFFLWPYGEWRRVWLLLPERAEISVEEGPPSQGDRDSRPYTTFLAFYARPVEARSVIARFAGGVELVGAEVAPSDGSGVRVRLLWRANAPLDGDYTVFLHYLRDGERIGQGDSQAAGGRYPTGVWRAGDVVCDEHVLPEVGAPLPGHDLLRLGFWRPEDGEKLVPVDEAGNPVGDWLDVPVGGRPVD